MHFYDTNIFPLLNLDKLTSHYRLFEIIGLSTNSEEFDSNVQHIIKRLSFQLGQPITVITKSQKDDEHIFLVVKDDPAVLKRIPEEFEVKKRESIYFRPTDEVLGFC